ncbi:DUF642 domain-containing protein [Nostoc sphaeroides]|uniref:Uncharacterized protein n=1 Tax=Nostoc sphaeroides CCNUC1 TaxID=2653204 RepID=A0A5P8VTS4_9NOSO|nr:DUF642 domain-containing protein [Nostoc sphaeroides]MCC5628491.1 DUF642 domain-containing protein [Nostoc sphaeroides CHAB 2801]QFS43777.1 hypothetical protein GXM_01250 [Nostoc sphaeroides CCNUC1]
MIGTSKTLLILSAFLASILTNLSPAKAVNLIKNGSFDNGLSQSQWLLLGNVGISTYDAYRTIQAIGISSSEPFLVTFNSGNTIPSGSISQTISTIAGQKYVLSFLYGNYRSPGLSIGTQSIKVDILDSSNASLVSQIIIDPTGSNNLGNILSSYSLSFIATSNQTIIKFSDTSFETDGIDGFLDNINVTPAP